jgi:hypothetical protein
VVVEQVLILEGQAAVAAEADAALQRWAGTAAPLAQLTTGRPTPQAIIHPNHYFFSRFYFVVFVVKHPVRPLLRLLELPKFKGTAHVCVRGRGGGACMCVWHVLWFVPWVTIADGVVCSRWRWGVRVGKNWAEMLELAKKPSKAKKKKWWVGGRPITVAIKLAFVDWASHAPWVVF